jgi:hypothetical protein
MSLPSFQAVRERIESIPNLGLNRCYKGVYITGSRIGEFAGLMYPSDPAQATGMHLTVSEDVYTVDFDNIDDIAALRAITLVEQGKEASMEDLAKICEPVAIFHITTEKRKGFVRHTALPLNPKYDKDGWTRQVFEYIKSRQRKDEPVFPYYRQQLYPCASELFEGFTYPIVTYKSLEDELVEAHQKDFANHALRHLRATELRSRYRIKEGMLDSYMGWTKQRGSGGSAMQDRYVLEPWKEAGYFPKLLRTFSYHFREGSGSK